jgi:hypothetical protein
VTSMGSARESAEFPPSVKDVLTCFVLEPQMERIRPHKSAIEPEASGMERKVVGGTGSLLGR